MNTRFERAMARFDEENSRDPNLEGAERSPRELVYARRLTDWVLKLQPDASEALRLAARAQHIRRWEVPRARFPADRAGYHRWKNELKRFHAEIASAILLECGYDEEMIARVRRLNLKEGFPADPEVQTMEDALCLVFLEFQLAELAERADEPKIVNALRKSWAKMSENARLHALRIELGTKARELVLLALGPEARPLLNTTGERVSGAA